MGRFNPSKIGRSRSPYTSTSFAPMDATTGRTISLYLKGFKNDLVKSIYEKGDVGDMLSEKQIAILRKCVSHVSDEEIENPLVFGIKYGTVFRDIFSLIHQLKETSSSTSLPQVDKMDDESKKLHSLVEYFERNGFLTKPQIKMSKAIKFSSKKRFALKPLSEKEMGIYLEMGVSTATDKIIDGEVRDMVHLHFGVYNADRFFSGPIEEMIEPKKEVKEEPPAFLSISKMRESLMVED